MGIVLASASPRRYELLQMLGISDFTVVTADCEERVSETSPGAAVCGIALDKARSAAEKCTPQDIIIAADTLVYLDGSPLGKPADRQDAVRMLKLLSGCMHTVYTGVAIIGCGITRTAAESTKVFFREIQEDEILRYVGTGEPLDKAGAYGAQGRGAVFIERIAGDFFTVVGLPLCRLSIMLREFGVYL